jgi:hypothetical protein
MQLGPQYAAGHVLGSMQKVMMVVPVDADLAKF